MDLRRFIAFKTVVEEGSFLRVLQKLCCTQSTVAFHIQQLEQEPIIPLFEKIGRRICFTAAGRNVLPHVYGLTKVVALVRQAVRQDDGPGGEFRVATGETLLAYKISPVLQRFKQRVPKVCLSLQSLNCYNICNALLADEVDLGVFYRAGSDDVFTMMELGPQSLALAVSVDQAPVDFLRPRQHIPLSFIIDEPQCVFRQILESTLRQRGTTMENTIELWSIGGIKQCVAGNLGVSSLSRPVVEEELKRRTLVELPFSETPLTIHALCAHHAGKTISPATRALMQCMQEEQEACRNLVTKTMEA